MVVCVLLSDFYDINIAQKETVQISTLNSILNRQ